jgi:hypothetical protein
MLSSKHVTVDFLLNLWIDFIRLSGVVFQHSACILLNYSVYCPFFVLEMLKRERKLVFMGFWNFLGEIRELLVDFEIELSDQIEDVNSSLYPIRSQNTKFSNDFLPLMNFPEVQKSECHLVDVLCPANIKNIFPILATNL